MSQNHSWNADLYHYIFACQVSCETPKNSVVVTSLERRGAWSESVKKNQEAEGAKTTVRRWQCGDPGTCVLEDTTGFILNWRGILLPLSQWHQRWGRGRTISGKPCAYVRARQTDQGGEVESPAAMGGVLGWGKSRAHSRDRGDLWGLASHLWGWESAARQAAFELRSTIGPSG